MTARPTLINRLFVLVWIAGFLEELQWSLLIQFPGFLTELGVTESRIGILYSASAVAGLTLRPLMGRLLDQTGRRQVLLVTGALNATAILALTLVGRFGPELFVLFLVHRVMQIAMFTAMLTFNADIVPVERRTEGFALLGLAGLMPLAFGGLLGDLVLGFGGFDALFVVAAGLGAMSWMVVWQLPRRVATGASDDRRGFFAASRQRDLLPVWLLSLLFAVSLEVLFTFLRTFVDERGIGSVGTFFLVYGLVAIVARVSTSSRLDLLPARAVLVASIAGFAIGFGLLAEAESLLPFALAAFLAGVAHGVAFPIIAAQVVTRARIAERGSALTIFTAIFDVALLGAAPVVGGLIDSRGYPTAFRLVGVGIAAGVAVYWLWDRRIEAMAAEPSRV